MKRLSVFVLLGVLCSSFAQAEINLFASVWEHKVQGTNITDWVEFRCKVYTTAPATDYQTYFGFNNTCEARWTLGDLIVQLPYMITTGNDLIAAATWSCTRDSKVPAVWTAACFTT
jgi:hypothetical protein